MQQRPAVAAAAPAATAGQRPPRRSSAPFWTRFPSMWLPLLTGDHLRSVTAAGDYARGADGYCWAADRTLAGGLGLHPDTVGAGLRAAEAADIVRAVRRPGGTSARVLVLPETDDDTVLWVCVSSYARNVLTAYDFLAYCALSVRQHLDEPTSMDLIARLTGMSPARARTAVAELLAAGWITSRDAPGRAARYTVHPAPLAGVATQLVLDFPRPRPVKVDRPAPAEPAHRGETDGQLALFDPADPDTTPHGSTVTTPHGSTATTPHGSTATTPHGSTATTPHGSTGRTRSPQQDLSNRPAAVGGCGSAVGDTAVPRDTGAPASTRDAAVRPAAASAAPEPRTLPPLLITPAAYRVLAEVPALVARMSRWEQRQAARAVGAAIETAAGDADRVADRLRRRYASADPDDVRRPYGWLAERGLTRRGCSAPACESGWDLVRDDSCRSCATRIEEARAVETARRAQHHPAPASEPAPAAARSRTWVCALHPSTSLPCGMCAAEPARTWAPVSDTTAGRQFREQRAARRLARETAAAAAAA
ncbi:hypothetical protein ACIQOW_08515 [Kitasatospora sp. NPDC091335]|uniref:hypothetical protein n=1 Tax=Kitasatospora sp. NPDC091335 TaxID=3364085 RepID=UPI0038065284